MDHNQDIESRFFEDESAAAKLWLKSHDHSLNIRLHSGFTFDGLPIPCISEKYNLYRKFIICRVLKLRQ